MKKLTINPSNKRYYSDEYIKGWEDGVRAQYEAPIDVVEVVRCKDCRWYEIPEAKIFENCCRNDYLIPMKPNDYCSYGKRREESEV